MESEVLIWGMLIIGGGLAVLIAFKTGETSGEVKTIKQYDTRDEKRQLRLVQLEADLEDKKKLEKLKLERQLNFINKQLEKSIAANESEAAYQKIISDADRALREDD